MLIPRITKNKFSKIPTPKVGILVKEWNIKYPIDRWFRQKYKLIWGSKEHREVTLLSIYFEFEEEKLYKEVVKDLLNPKPETERDSIKYKPGNWYNSESVEIIDEESIDLYEKLDLNSLEEDKDGNIIVEKQ